MAVVVEEVKKSQPLRIVESVLHVPGRSIVRLLPARLPIALPARKSTMQSAKNAGHHTTSYEPCTCAHDSGAAPDRHLYRHRSEPRHLRSPARRKDRRARRTYPRRRGAKSILSRACAGHPMDLRDGRNHRRKRRAHRRRLPLRARARDRRAPASVEPARARRIALPPGHHAGRTPRVVLDLPGGPGLRVSRLGRRTTRAAKRRRGDRRPGRSSRRPAGPSARALHHPVARRAPRLRL